MTAGTRLLVPLRDCADSPGDVVGSKAAMLGRLLPAGLPVPDGYCLTHRNLLHSPDDDSAFAREYHYLRSIALT